MSMMLIFDISSTWALWCISYQASLDSLSTVPKYIAEGLVLLIQTTKRHHAKKKPMDLVTLSFNRLAIDYTKYVCIET